MVATHCHVRISGDYQYCTPARAAARIMCLLVRIKDRTSGASEGAAREAQVLTNGLSDDISMVYFSDDNTVHNVKRAWELAEKIKEHKIKKKLQ